MKKKYIAPEIEVIEFAGEIVLAGASHGATGTTTETGDEGDISEGGGGGSNAKPMPFVWEEDYEDGDESESGGSIWDE